MSTTDFATHTHAPETEPSRRNIREIDRLIGEIVNAVPDLDLVVTADHGMNAKTWGLDLGAILAAAGIDAQAIPIIKDRNVVHHRNLGGAAYIYLRDLSAARDAAATLRAEKGVEAVLTGAEAAGLYHLHPERIGHLFLLADRETVFGDLPQAREELHVRSHGSLHEREIPIYARERARWRSGPRPTPRLPPGLFDSSG